MKKYISIIIFFCAAMGAVSCGGRKPAEGAVSHRPVIGITCSRGENGAASLAVAYSEAVVKGGGVAMVIPTVGSSDEAAAAVAAIDGIVFSGGEDINPRWYGEEILNGTVSIDPVRDRSDSLLAVAALASGKPVLAICRGEQLLNVMLGGSLYQDLPEQLGVRHSGGLRHRIGVEEGSVLAELFGTDSLEVNSFHHQSVKEPGKGVRITARSADGVVEAWEAEGVTAVQFHPEKMVKAGESEWERLFGWFVGECELICK